MALMTGDQRSEWLQRPQGQTRKERSTMALAKEPAQRAVTATTWQSKTKKKAATTAVEAASFDNSASGDGCSNSGGFGNSTNTASGC